MSGQLATWLAVAALAVNYGARAVIPVVAHVVCAGGSVCDAATLIGSVASSFFAGDLLAQVAAKPLVRQLGGKHLLALGALGLAVSLATVASLVRGPLPIFLAAQGVFGFCCGLGYPAAHALLAEAVPADRRSTAVSLIVGASAAGTMLSNFATPFAVDRAGWLSPFVFFVAASGLVAAVVETLCPHAAGGKTSSSSAFMPSGKKGGSPSPAAELRRWLADPLVEAMILAMYASGVANAFLYSFIPTLFVEVYHVKIADLALLTTSAPLVNAGVCVLSGVLADQLIGQCGWPAHRCRMLMQLLGTAIPTLSLIMFVSGAATTTSAAAVLVTGWMAAHGFQTAGLTASFHDVGKQRASELFALGNVFSKLAGVLAGQVFSRVARAWSWEVVLFGIAVHYVVSGGVFISLLGRANQTRQVIVPDEAPQDDDPVVVRATSLDSKKASAFKEMITLDKRDTIDSSASTHGEDSVRSSASDKTDEDVDAMNEVELLEGLIAQSSEGRFRGGHKHLQAAADR